MKIIKRILKWIGAICGVFLLLGVAQVGWGLYREPIAKQQAADFCASVRIGQSTDGLAERAIESGAEKAFAKWGAEPSGVRTMLVIYIGMPPFSRHICAIKATDVVLSAASGHMD